MARSARTVSIKIGLVLLFFLLTACFGPLPAPDISTYRIEAVSHQRVQATPSHLTLLVATPAVNSDYQTRNMVYSTEPYQSRFFAKSQWIAPPAQMLLPLLVTSLQNTRHFHAVVAPPFPGLAEVSLDTRLLEFRQEFFNDRSQFKMVLLAVLIKTSTSHVIVERRFSATVAASENNPYGGVVAANQATQQILQQLSRWCVDYANAAVLPPPPKLHWHRRHK